VASLYRRAVDEVVPVSGFYHDNYLVQRDGVIYVVRVNRKLDEPDVEPRMYAEAAVLAALRNADIAAPDIFHDSSEHGFTVISYLPGQRIADLYPPGTQVPDSLIEFIGSTMSKLYRVERENLGTMLRQSPWPRAAGEDAFLPSLLSSPSTNSRSCTCSAPTWEMAASRRADMAIPNAARKVALNLRLVAALVTSCPKSNAHGTN